MSEHKRSVSKRILEQFLTTWPLFVAAVVTATFGWWVYGLASESVKTAGGQWITRWVQFRTGEPNTMGDTLAGFIGSLTLIWVVASVIQQGIELRAQRKQISTQTKEFEETNLALIAQRFDNAVFALLSTHSELLRGISVKNSVGEMVSGRLAFRQMFYDIQFYYNDEKISDDETVRLRLAYERFWKKYEFDVSHYLRFLYNFFRFLSNNKELSSYHAKLVRSQISDFEAIVIFYNCLSPKGVKFTKFAEEFELFNNLPLSSLLSPKHAELLPKRSFGESLAKSGATIS